MKDKSVRLIYNMMHALFWFSYAVTWAFTAVYLQDKGYDSVVIGMVNGIGAVLSVIMQPVFAALIRRSSRFDTKRNILLLKLGGLAAGIMLLFPLPGTYTTAVLFLLLAAIDASIPSMLSSLAMDYVNGGKYINYGLARGIGSIIYAVSGLTLGYAVAAVGTQLLMILYAAANVVLLVIVCIFPYDKKQLAAAGETGAANGGERGTEAGSAGKSSSGGIAILRSYGFLGYFLAASVLLFMGHNMINVFLINVVERAGGGSGEMGVALAIAAAVELPVMGCFVKVAKRIPAERLLVATGIFFLLKSLLTIFALQVWMVYAVQFLQFGAFALFTPASVYFINQSMKERDRGLGQALLGSFSLGLGGAGGSVLGGILIRQTGVVGMLVCTTLLALLGALCMGISMRKYGRSKGHE